MQYYNVFSKADLERIHEATLTLLGNKGIVFQSQEAIELFKHHGAKTDRNIVYIPASLIEKSIANTPSAFRLHAINSTRSVTVGEGLLIHPAGGEVFVSDKTGERREAMLDDFTNIQKIYQACDNIDMTGYQPVSPKDVPQSQRGLKCTLMTMLYTDKPWLAPMDFVGTKEKNKILDLYEIAFGKDFVRNNHVTWNVVSPESPLIFSEICCEGIISFVRRNQPVAIVSAPMSGITGPIHSMGTILLQNAETVAGICLAQISAPGIPVLPSASLSYGNMKLASWECACPDAALMVSGAVQMYRDYYNLPTRAQTGVTSSKCVDYQAGMETMQSLLLNALGGVNVTSQSAGALENLLTVSLAKTVIDDELISRVRRILAGIKSDDVSLSLDILMDSEHGSDFLTHDSTLECLYDGWQPDLSNWDTFENWSILPDRDIETRASNKVQEILEKSREPILENGIARKLNEYINSKC